MHREASPRDGRLKDHVLVHARHVLSQKQTPGFGTLAWSRYKVVTLGSFFRLDGTPVTAADLVPVPALITFAMVSVQHHPSALSLHGGGCSFNLQTAVTKMAPSAQHHVKL
jgi:hypothetical protein